MQSITIEGNKNIANTGIIQGDCIINNITVNVDLMELTKFIAMGEKETSLANMTEAQKKLAEAIETFAKTELIRAEEGKLRAEAEIIRAKADENNSLANLNYSKIMLEDREIIKVMLEKLK